MIVDSRWRLFRRGVMPPRFHAANYTLQLTNPEFLIVCEVIRQTLHATVKLYIGVYLSRRLLPIYRVTSALNGWSIYWTAAGLPKSAVAKLCCVSPWRYLSCCSLLAVFRVVFEIKLWLHSGCFPCNWPFSSHVTVVMLPLVCVKAQMSLAPKGKSTSSHLVCLI